jgi:thiamine pyrophosphokinase
MAAVNHSLYVFTGGASPEPQNVAHIFEISGQPAYVLAADSGLVTAESYASVFGFTVDCVIGDMDSAPAQLLAKYPNKETFPQDKDDTDTVLALKKACMLFADAAPIILIGGAGGRADHMLAIAGLLGSSITPDYWLTPEQVVCVIGNRVNRLEVTGLTAQDVVSIFPAAGGKRIDGVQKIHAEGLFWNINDLDWQSGGSLSNKIAPEYIDRAVRLTAEKGSFAVFVPLRPGVNPYQKKC